MSAADEGRELLTMLWDSSCEWKVEDLNDRDNWEIETWCEEMGYEWDNEKKSWIPAS